MSPELWIWLALALGTVAIGLAILLITEREKKKPHVEEHLEPSQAQMTSVSPQPVKKTVTNDIINEAKDKLRLLDLEREILSYGVRRLYEASAEGKISEAERDRLALKYKMDLTRIKEEIEKGESIVALSELETMQQDLVKMFSERFEEMNRKIEDLRSKSGFAAPAPKETITSETVKEPPSEKEEPQEEAHGEEKAENLKQPAEKTDETKTKKTSKPKSSAQPETGDAEKKVEQIMAEIEKEIKKLRQMEVEE